jgi:Carboxypeptidase regulatory-like domain
MNTKGDPGDKRGERKLDHQPNTMARLRHRLNTKTKYVGLTVQPKKLLFKSLSVAVLSVGWHAVCLAQSTFGMVRGTVVDATGSVIAGATVTVHSVEESVDRVSTSNGSGDFSIENLKPGTYRLTIHRDGFSDALVPSVTLAARQELRIPVSLQISAENTVVDVQADSVVMNTENATISDEMSNVQLTQLPLNNRATSTSPLGALGLSSNV